MYRQYHCWNQFQYCISLIEFTTPQCTNFDVAFTAKCGSCIKRIDRTTGQPMFFRIDCDYATQAATLHTKCGPLCLECPGPQTTSPFAECSAGYTFGNKKTHYIYNQGISPCDVMEIMLYNVSSCTGFAEERFAVGQHECTTFGDYFSCSADPVPLPPPNGEIIFSMCPEGSIGCTNCNVMAVPNGECSPAPPGETRFQSRQATCDMTEAMCATLVLHNNTGCTGYIGTHAPVCGSCSFFPREETYSLTQCDPNSQTITLSRGCNAGCTQCSGGQTVFGFMKCTVGGPQNGYSFFNRGLFPCSTVTFSHFSSTNCAVSTLITTFKVTEGVCQFDGKVECALNSITVQNCSCATCAAVPVAGFCTQDAFGFYRQYKCMNQASQCGQIAFFADSSCTQFETSWTAVCGQCMRNEVPGQPLPQYSLVSCDPQSQTVTYSTDCDSTCTTCGNPNSVVHPFNTCVKTQFGYSFNQGISTCDAVSVTVYSDPLCFVTVASWTAAQHTCSFGEFIACSADPVVAVPPANAVNFFECPPGARECNNCQLKSQFTGSCVTTSYGSQTTTCDTMQSTCAVFVFHNGPTCGSFLGFNYPVCGSCFLVPNGTTYASISCDYISQNITFSLDCDSACKTCSSPNAFTHGYLQCSRAYFNNSISIFNRGIAPCSTVTQTQYLNPTCQGGASGSLGTFKFAEGLCEFNRKAQCYNTSNPAPSPPPGQGGSPSPSSSSGEAAGIGIGIAVGIIGAAAIVGFVMYKLKGARASRYVDEAVMNEPRAGYGAVNGR